MVLEPPPRLVRALHEAPADERAADTWLAGLPKLAEAAVARRGLAVERVHAPGGRSSLVVLVHLADGVPAVLKLASPAARQTAERAALAQWHGLGAVRMLDDPAGTDDGALLLERLRPDVSVRSLPEAQSMLEAAGTLRRLWVEPPRGHLFESVAERTERLAKEMRAGADTAEVTALVRAALDARDLLVAGPSDVRLLHGAFRAGKVLGGDRMPWLAIGPDPVVGECAFDLARLVRDRAEDLIASSSGATTVRRRVRRLAESLEVDQERLRGWTLFRAVASGVRALRAGRRQDGELLLEFATWL